MVKRRKSPTRARIDVGFAADRSGRGVVYGQVLGPATNQLLRVPFSITPRPALLGRDLGYAALTAIATDVRTIGVEIAEFIVDDERLAVDIVERRPLPGTLAVPYVRLRCALNRFRSAVVETGGRAAGDLSARARAEVELNVAA